LRALHAKVLLALGRAHEAQHAMREAIARFERKGATALAKRARLHEPGA